VDGLPRFDANLTLMYTEYAFAERFAAAAADGFTGVEYLGPYDEPKEAIADRLARHGLEQVLFNLPVGRWSDGERGIAALPGREEEFRDGVDLALHYALALGTRQLNCLVGLVPDPEQAEAAEDQLARNLAYAAARLGDAGIKLMFEPLNTRDVPGYFVSTIAHAERILNRVGSDNLYVHYDFYHQQVSEGDLLRNFQRLADRVVHVQIADNPGRHEPGTGEINYSFLLGELDRLGYAGWVGCEYLPRGRTSSGLGWMRPIMVAAGEHR
jgi:hydroxypyruvate isomerase